MLTEDIEILEEEKTEIHKFEKIEMEDLPPRQPVNLRLSPLAIKKVIKNKLLLDKGSPFQEELIKQLEELEKLDAIENIKLIKMENNVIFALIPPGILKGKGVLFFFQIEKWIEQQIKALLKEHYPDHSVCYQDIALGGVIGGPGRKVLYDYFFTDSSLQHSFCIWKLPGEAHLIIEDPRDGIISWGLEVLRSLIYPRSPSIWPIKLQNILDDEYCSVAAIGMFFKALDRTQEYLHLSKVRHTLASPEVHPNVRGFEIISMAEGCFYSRFPRSSSEIFNEVYKKFTLKSLGLEFDRRESQEAILERFARKLSEQSKKKELPLTASPCSFFSLTDAKRKLPKLTLKAEAAITDEQDDFIVKDLPEDKTSIRTFAMR